MTASEAVIREGAVGEELMRARFESIAASMGELLRRTALSTNVKERLDFSCALLDGEGRLLVNAPHIPVHLGALGVCVRKVSEGREWREGDVVVVNHPGFGGSHLPDVTVVSPVFGLGRRGGGFCGESSPSLRDWREGSGVDAGGCHLFGGGGGGDCSAVVGRCGGGKI